MTTPPDKPPFQFGLGSLLAIVAIAGVLFAVPRPAKLFWHEIIWRGLSTPAADRAGEGVVGVLLAVIFLVGVGVGVLWAKNR